MSYSSNIKILRREDNFLIINSSSGKWDICPSHKIKEVIPKFEKFSITSSSYQREGLICVLHLTNKCNLECKYCYTDIGSGERNVLSNNVITKFLDILTFSPYESILIEFHGGEPLLYWKRIKSIVLRYHKKRRFYFGIQTNATLLTQEIIDFIKMYSITIGISIDGHQKIHDRNRCYPNGKGSFQKVMKGISLLQQNRIPFTTISVVEKPDECKEIFDFFVNNRIKKIKLNPLSFQGRSVKKDIISHDIDKYQQEFATEHLNVTKKIIEHNKIYSSKIICGNIAVMIRSLITPDRYMCSKSPCGAGTSIIMIDEKGNIYPCEEMYGKKDFIITTVENVNNIEEFEEILKYSPSVLKLKERRVENIPGCKDCIWRRFCGGGCTSNSLSMFNSLKRGDVMCQYRQIMFEELIWILWDDKNNILLLTKPENFLNRREAGKT